MTRNSPKYGKGDVGEINGGISEELYIKSLIWQGKGRPWGR